MFFTEYILVTNAKLIIFVKTIIFRLNIEFKLFFVIYNL